MPSRRSISTVQWGGEGLGDQHISQPQSRVLPAPVSQLSNSPMALRRTMLVSNLFKHMKEIQNIDNGYALRFHRSEDLEDPIGIIADYIVFESLNSPQLTFALVEEPQAKAFWLQVRGLKSDHHDVTLPSVSSDSAVSLLV